MDEEGIFESLSSDEHRAVWDETEQKFWSQFTQDQQTWRASHDEKYRAASTDLRVELSSLTGQRNTLNATHARLARELADVEEELRAVGGRCETKSNELSELDEEHRAQLAAQVEHWEHQARTMTNFFRKKRGDPPLPESEPITNGFHASEPMERVEQATNGVTTHAPTPDEDTEKLADVIGADGNVIGPIQRIEPWNQWVDAVLKLPIQRPVKIRRGRRFNEEHLATIYDRSEAKGVKWLSCMIQAIGQIQSKRCQSCDKNQGAFENCIIVGGDLLQKCGNCEWNRQGCHGASGETIDVRAAEKLVREREERERQAREEQERQQRQLAERDRQERERIQRAREEELREQKQRELERRQLEEMQQRREQERQEQEVLARQAMAAESATHSAQWRAIRAEQPSTPEQRNPDRPMGVLRRPQGPADRDILMNDVAPPPPPLPEPRIRQPLPVQAPPREARDYPITGGFTPANQRSRPPSREMYTPATRSVEQSPQPMDEKPDQPLAEITRDNLILRHDGNVYTYPECMVGVPVAKIHPGHPYWALEWKDVRSEVVDARERWRQKHQAAIDAEARQEKTGSSKYQIGRQVNRGTKILEFLDDENQISPYQLLGKRYMHSSKGGITSYDTLFRLCETLSELSKFNLDITPVDWMRHRLHEIMTEQNSDGEKNFNLPKTVHDFYHDPKLTALRHKHGYKNIGRPSGQNKGPGPRSSLGSVNGGTPKPKKRKSQVSLVGTPREHSYVESPLASQMIIHDEGPFLAARSQLAKKPKMENDQSTDELAEYSDKDSVSDEPLRREDFRLLQIQSRLHASSTKDTQYWSWLPDQRKLEHRVLQSTNPVQWGALKDPFDFSLRLDEVAEIRYDVTTNRVYIHVPQERDTAAPVVGWRRRGDLMVEFKRTRTFKRFLGFCEALRVPLQDLPAGMLSRWEDFQADRSDREAEPAAVTAAAASH